MSSKGKTKRWPTVLRWPDLLLARDGPDYGELFEHYAEQSDEEPAEDGDQEQDHPDDVELQEHGSHQDEAEESD